MRYLIIADNFKYPQNIIPKKETPGGYSSIYKIITQ